MAIYILHLIVCYHKYLMNFFDSEVEMLGSVEALNTVVTKE